MTRRILAAIVGLTAVAPVSAQAFDLAESRVGAPAWMRAAAVPAPHPLTGTGENMRIVANLPFDNSDYAASDIELAGNYAYVGSYSEGMVIADISDPLHPKRAGTFRCGGGSQYDVQLSNDANLAVLSTDSAGASCLKAGQEGSMIIDVSDKTNPRMVGFIPIAVGTHTQTLDDRILYVNNYPARYSKLEIFDLTKPAEPRRVGQLSFGGEDSIHDSFVDHRPDGKTLLYAASIGFTDVIDVSDVSAPSLLQRIADPTVTISHQAEPNYKRDTLLVTDEFLGGQVSPVCGKFPITLGEGYSIPNPLLPIGGDPTDIGALHFYKLDAQGAIVNNGRGSGKYGTFNIPVGLNPNVLDDAGCTIHVLWQAPDENRLVTAWYGHGTWLVDFTDPAKARSIGHFTATSANTWAAKPHRVGGKSYVFTGDIKRGMDVLEYTGEQGKRWPATAGPAEDQRIAYRNGQKIPAGSQPGGGAMPGAGGSGKRTLGGANFRRTIRIGGRSGSRRLVTLTFRDARGGILSRLRYRVRSGRRTTLRAKVGGVAGSYRYDVRQGSRGRVLARGRLKLRAGAKGFPKVRANQTLVCRLV